MRKIRLLVPFAACLIVGAAACVGLVSPPVHVSARDNKPLPQLERAMVSMINRERGKSGLKPLELDAELTEVAREHSTDMLVRRYFSHITPEGANPFDRMVGARIKYRSAAENIALAATLEMAHTMLMGSQGHRENILYKGFHRVGIGVIDGGARGLMISQEFRD